MFALLLETLSRRWKNIISCYCRREKTFIRDFHGKQQFWIYISALERLFEEYDFSIKDCFLYIRSNAALSLSYVYTIVLSTVYLEIKDCLDIALEHKRAYLRCRRSLRSQLISPAELPGSTPYMLRLQSIVRKHRKRWKGVNQSWRTRQMHGLKLQSKIWGSTSGTLGMFYEFKISNERTCLKYVYKPCDYSGKEEGLDPIRVQFTITIDS